MDKEKTIEDMVRDFSKVTPRSKKEIRLRITDFVNYREREEYARGREKGRTEAPERYTPTQNNRQTRRGRVNIADRVIDLHRYAFAPADEAEISPFEAWTDRVAEIPTSVPPIQNIDPGLRNAIIEFQRNNTDNSTINSYVRAYTNGRYGYQNGMLVDDAQTTEGGTPGTYTVRGPFVSF